MRPTPAQIVTPLFRCMAFAVDKQGGQGVEIAARMGYDDFNECFARRDVVHEVPRIKMTGTTWVPFGNSANR